MDLERRVGLHPGGTSVVADRKALIRYINLKLAALGCPTAGDSSQTAFLEVARDLLADYREFSRLLDGYLCPADQRIQTFLNHSLPGDRPSGPLPLPHRTFVVDRHGLARELSLPIDGDEYKNDLVE